MALPAVIGLVSIYLDIVNRQAYGSQTGGPFSLPGFYYKESVWVAIYPMIPVPSPPGTRVWSLLGTTINGMSMTVGPLQINDSTNLLVNTVAMTPSVPNSQAAFWYGELPFSSANLDTAFAANPTSIGSFFQVIYGDLDLSQKVAWQPGCVINNVVATPGGTVPAPSPGIVYPTLAQLKQLFVPLQGVAGQTFTLVSQNGAHTRTLGENNDGTPMDINQ